MYSFLREDKNKEPKQVLYWAAINWKTLFFNQNETFNIYFDLLKTSIVYHIIHKVVTTDKNCVKMNREKMIWIYHQIVSYD